MNRTRILSTAAALLLVALPASATVFEVNLVNGSQFETRYQPIEDPDNPDKIMLLTVTGNWISLPKAVVTSIESDIETEGYGLVIDSVTVAIGMSPNDAPNPDEEGEVDPATALLRYFERQDAAAQVPYNLEQFVEPNQTGGFPLGWTYSNTPPIGASDRFLTPQDRFTLPPDN